MSSISNIPKAPRGVPYQLFDKLIAEHDLKNDAGLARALDVAPPVISKHRRRSMPIGDSMILRIHETFDMPVRAIRAEIAGPV